MRFTFASDAGAYHLPAVVYGVRGAEVASQGAEIHHPIVLCPRERTRGTGRDRTGTHYLAGLVHGCCGTVVTSERAEINRRVATRPSCSAGKRDQQARHKKQGREQNP